MEKIRPKKSLSSISYSTLSLTDAERLEWRKHGALLIGTGTALTALSAATIILRSVFLGKLLNTISTQSVDQFTEFIAITVIISITWLVSKVVHSVLVPYCCVAAENAILHIWIPQILRKTYPFYMKLGQARIQTMTHQLLQDVDSFVKNTLFKVLKLPYISEQNVHRVNTSLHQTTENTLRAAACAIAFFFLSWKIALVITLFIFTSIFTTVRIQKWYQEVEKIQQKTTLDMDVRLSSIFARFVVVKAFGTEKYEAEKVKRNVKLSRSYLVPVAVYKLVSQMIVGFLYPIVLGYGGYLVLSNEMSYASLTIVYFLAVQFSVAAQAISDDSNKCIELYLSYKRFQETFGDMSDNETYQNRIEDFPNVELQTIKFRNVSYEEGNKQILDRISCEIPAGSKVALVGPSGAGKSTVLNLLMHLIIPTSGQLLIGEQNTPRIPVNLYRQNIAYVPQDSMLITGTVRENICYGKDYTDQEMYEAAKAASAHDFIMKLPVQYDTVVGEGGVQLSGGQRQRICIARAFCRKAKLLILDEVSYSFSSISLNVDLRIHPQIYVLPCKGDIWSRRGI
ncbi:hypothetical protein HK102_014207 [Quaeritorhiza haematococci]|nr:hypothetical protein HK102_014207 [Quaeritorhiza haematococci]